MTEVETAISSLPEHMGPFSLVAIAIGQGVDNYLATVLVRRNINVGIRKDLGIPTMEYVVWTVNLPTQGCSGGIYIPCAQANQAECLEKAWEEFSLRAKYRLDVDVQQETAQ